MLDTNSQLSDRSHQTVYNALEKRGYRWIQAKQKWKKVFAQLSDASLSEIDIPKRNFSIRLPSTLITEMRTNSSKNGKSLTTWITEAIQEKLNKDESVDRLDSIQDSVNALTDFVIALTVEINEAKK